MKRLITAIFLLLLTLSSYGQPLPREVRLARMSNSTESRWVSHSSGMITMYVFSENSEEDYFLGYLRVVEVDKQGRPLSDAMILELDFYYVLDGPDIFFLFTYQTNIDLTTQEVISETPRIDPWQSYSFDMGIDNSAGSVWIRISGTAAYLQKEQ